MYFVGSKDSVFRDEPIDFTIKLNKKNPSRKRNELFMKNIFSPLIVLICLNSFLCISKNVVQCGPFNELTTFTVLKN